MSAILAATKTAFRRAIRPAAQGLQWISHGRITPAMVTWTGLIMHVPIAVLIARNQYYWAAGLLIIFGLFDTLDGELARLQNSASPRGMFLDASTDRFKEVLLYSGVAYTLAAGLQPTRAVWAAVAVGASLCVSYVKAKGEAAVASQGASIDHAVLNKMFGDGLMGFEIRMSVLIAGLIFHQVYPAVVLIGLLAAATALQRLAIIMKRL